MKTTTLLSAVLCLTMATTVNASCYKERNIYGNLELKCDSLNDYPDKNPNDNYPNSWSRGHQAGADWARKHGITNPNDCSGWSRSFVQGCMIQADR